MISPVSLKDVAQATGMSISAVSLVVNGKAGQRRISPTTQERIRTAARQLGYQPNLAARDIVLRRGVKPPSGTSGGKPPAAEKTVNRRQIGVILSSTSSPETLSQIAGLIPKLGAGEFELVIATVPVDPGTVHERVAQFLSEGMAGLLCCPTVYSAVSEAVAGKYPVIVPWAGAGKAMLMAVSPQQADAPVAHSGQSAVSSQNAEPEAPRKLSPEAKVPS
ncbi:MAG: LacI family DNA-binding transcriptional regulator, partial [bacterium]